MTVSFDKTGTLTRGDPKVTDLIALSGSGDDVLAKAAAVERNVSHPLDIATVEAAQEHTLELPQVFGGGAAVPGKAVTARLKSGFASVGSPHHAAEETEVGPRNRTPIRRSSTQNHTLAVPQFNAAANSNCI